MESLTIPQHVADLKQLVSKKNKSSATKHAYSILHGPRIPLLPLRPAVAPPTQNATPLPHQLPKHRAQERFSRYPAPLPTSLPRRKQRPSTPPPSAAEQKARLSRVRTRSHLHATPRSIPGSRGRSPRHSSSDAIHHTDSDRPSAQSTSRSNGLQRRMLRNPHRRRAKAQRSGRHRKRKTRPPQLHQLFSASRRRTPLTSKPPSLKTSPRPSGPPRPRRRTPLPCQGHDPRCVPKLRHGRHGPLRRPCGAPHQPTPHGRAGVRRDVVWREVPAASLRFEYGGVSGGLSVSFAHGV